MDPNILRQHNFCSLKGHNVQECPKHFLTFWLLYSLAVEVEETTWPHNVAVLLPSDTASFPRRMESQVYHYRTFKMCPTLLLLNVSVACA
jgi:hypothetical protein